ncbi:hypothetical protein ACOSP7_019053 [Xanthoceras sorbifolium]
MDVVFVEQKPFFNKTYLQRESEKEDDQFSFKNSWNPSTSDLPNSVFPMVLNDYEEVIFHKETESRNIELGTNQLPNVTDSDLGGEILQDKDPNLDNYPITKLKVYTRKKPQCNKEQPHPAPSRLPSPSLGIEQAVTQQGKRVQEEDKAGKSLVCSDGVLSHIAPAFLVAHYIFDVLYVLYRHAWTRIFL